MLVPGLENAALSKMISGGTVSDAHLYTWLCKCGREILVKYGQKQEVSERLAIKTEAVKALLSELGGASENPRETILSALTSHAKALQGYEHLFSAKGNTFALMEQTQGLRESNDQSPVSLLRYHDLKNKLLGPDTPLTARQKKVISELAEKKSLTLRMFEVLEAHPRITARIVIRLHQEDLLEPGLCTRVLVHPHTSRAVAAVVKLHQENLLNPELYTGVLEHQDPFGAAVALVKLHKEKLLKPDLCARLLAHLHPFSAAIAVVKLHQADLLKSDLYARVLEHKSPGSAARALLKLNKSSLFKPDLCIRVLEHPDPSAVVVALVKANHGNLLKSNMCARVPEYKKSDSAISNIDNVKTSAAIIVVHSPSEAVKLELLYGLLARKMADDIKGFYMALRSNHPDIIAAFIEKSTMIIAELPLEEKQKYELLCMLLASPGANSMPGFFIALLNGNTEAITAFVKAIGTAIARFILPEEEKAKLLCELLASKAASGVPGFLMTLYNGHTKAVTAFIQESTAAIVALSLSEAEKAKLLYELLVSKKANGTPGFYIVLQNGHVEAITTFIQESAAAINRVIPSEAKKAKLLCELLASKNADGTPSFYAALYDGHTEAITAFIQASTAAIVKLVLPEEEKAKLLCELLASKNADGTPSFYVALYGGHTKAVTAFIQASAAAIVKLTLPEEEKARLLCQLLASKERTGNVPGLYVTLQQGHTEAITAFIQESTAVIAKFSLPKAEKAKLLCGLLASKEASGVPGFYMALQNGHSGAITAFIQASAAAIDELSLSEAEKAKLLYDLLSSKAVNNTPGFHIALRNGHTDVITAFIQESAVALARLILPEAKKAKLLCELLASKNADGTPSFYAALYDGHTEAITAFIQASTAVIAKFSLPKAEKAKLLCELLVSKKAEGMPGFYMALKNGHTEAVTAFIRESAAAMSALYKSKEERAELIYGLFDRIGSDNKEKFLLVLERGGPAASKVFTEGIDQLPLSAEQKRNLKTLGI